MGKKRLTFTDEIRHAVENSGLSRYRICKELCLAESAMSRFMNGTGWFGPDYLDALAELLDLHIAAKPRRKKRIVERNRPWRKFSGPFSISTPQPARS
jgi:hypothetical protein